MKILYKLKEFIGNGYKIYIACILVTLCGIYACLSYGWLLADYLEWNSAKDRYKKDLETQQAQLQDTYQKATALKIEVETLTKKRAQLTKIEKELLDLSEQLTAKKTEFGQLAGAIEQKAAELQKLQQEVSAASAQLSDTETKLAPLSIELKGAEDRKKQLAAQNEALVEEGKKLSQRLQQLRNDVKEAEAQQAQLQTALANAQKALSETQGAIQAAKDEEAQLNSKLASLRKDRDDLQAQQAELQRKLDEMGNSRANARVRAIESQLASLQQSIQAQEEEIRAKTTEKATVENELAELIRQRDVARTEADGLVQLKAERQGQLDALKRELETLQRTITTARAEQLELADSVQALQQEKREQEQNKSALQSELDSLNRQIAQKRAELEKLQQQATEDN